MTLTDQQNGAIPFVDAFDRAVKLACTPLIDPTAVPPMVDAFNYNWAYGWRYQRSNMIPFKHMESLRRTQQDYRMRILSFPGEEYEVVPAYETVQAQKKVAAGSYMWGIWCGGLPPSNTPVLVAINVGKQQYPLVVSPMPLLTETPTLQLPLSGPVGLLPEPLVLGDECFVNVTLANPTTTSQTIRLLAFIAEPKQAILDKYKATNGAPQR